MGDSQPYVMIYVVSLIINSILKLNSNNKKNYNLFILKNLVKKLNSYLR